MKVSEKPVRTSVGVFFVAFALVNAILLLPDAHKSQSPVLYLFVLGGLFVGVPAALGIGIIIEKLRVRKRKLGPSRN